MTPERLTGLGALIIEFRDWIESEYEASLDLVLLNDVLSVIALYRQLLVQQGAR